MNVMIVEMLTRKKNALSALMALPKYEWAGRRVSGHSPVTSQLFPVHPLC